MTNPNTEKVDENLTRTETAPLAVELYDAWEYRFRNDHETVTSHIASEST